MSESPQIEFEQRNSWAERFANSIGKKVETKGIIVKEKDTIQTFIDEEVVSDIISYWKDRGSSSEVGGWLIGEEGDFEGHKYLQITKNFRDSGKGSAVDIEEFRDETNAEQFVLDERAKGRNLVMIGISHTHPAGWSGRITLHQDAHSFASLELRDGRPTWAKKRFHIVVTPDEGNVVDVWQIKGGPASIKDRLIRTGFYLLKRSEPRVRVKNKVRVKS